MKLAAYENFLKDYLHVVLTSPQLSALLPASSSESCYHLRLSATAGAAYSESSDHVLADVTQSFSIDSHACAICRRQLSNCPTFHDEAATTSTPKRVELVPDVSVSLLYSRAGV